MEGWSLVFNCTTVRFKHFYITSAAPEAWPHSTYFNQFTLLLFSAFFFLCILFSAGPSFLLRFILGICLSLSLCLSSLSPSRAPSDSHCKHPLHFDPPCIPLRKLASLDPAAKQHPLVKYGQKRNTRQETNRPATTNQLTNR